MNAGNSLWSNVGSTCPQRMSGVHYQDRMVRGEPWLFVYSEITGQSVRINALARQLVRNLDGRTCVEDLLQQLDADVDAHERESIAHVLSTLEHHGLVSMNRHSSDRLQHRLAKETVNPAWHNWRNPLAIRFPLVDPDRWLVRLAEFTQGIPGRRVLRIALWLIGLALLTSLFNGRELIAQLAHLARTPQHWWQLLVVYPVLKFLHEMSHGLMVKRFGGAVHEMGITLLVLMPVPYVDASDTWCFASRRQRVLVSAAGMLAEGVIAAIGLFVWLLVEPGTLRDMGFAFALTGSISTLMFNANPLLKFDGYHILQDLVDMPNLGPRASRYLHYLLRRYLLGIQTARSPVSALHERRWLMAYGIGAMVYRWIITLGIALYLATRFPTAGMLLALFALYQLAARPMLKAMDYLLNTQELADRRPQALGLSGALASLLLGAVFLLPIPTNTRAQGVVSVPRQAQLFAPQSGEIVRLLVAEGESVSSDQVILTLRSPELETKLSVLRSELEATILRHNAAVVEDTSAVPALWQDIQSKRQAVRALSHQVDELTVRAGSAGLVSLDSTRARTGQYVRAGMSLGHIVSPGGVRIEAVVGQSSIARVEAGVRSVQVRLAERFAEPHEGTLVRQTPAGNRRLPSQALAGKGIGGIAVASTHDNQWETVEPVFHLEVALPPGIPTTGIGGRAYITLSHQPESLGNRTLRTLRQLLLDRLAI